MFVICGGHSARREWRWVRFGQERPAWGVDGTESQERVVGSAAEAKAGQAQRLMRQRSSKWRSVALCRVPFSCASFLCHISESESEFSYSVLLWNNHLPIRYRHRQSGSTAYRLQARLAPTGPGLQLTAMPRPNLPFNGLHLHNPCKLNVLNEHLFRVLAIC